MTGGCSCASLVDASRLNSALRCALGGCRGLGSQGFAFLDLGSQGFALPTNIRAQVWCALDLWSSTLETTVEYCGLTVAFRMRSDGGDTFVRIRLVGGGLSNLRVEAPGKPPYGVNGFTVALHSRSDGGGLSTLRVGVPGLPPSC